jgi:hypothetical protein
MSKPNTNDLPLRVLPAARRHEDENAKVLVADNGKWGHVHENTNPV